MQVLVVVFIVGCPRPGRPRHKSFSSMCLLAACVQELSCVECDWRGLSKGIQGDPRGSKGRRHEGWGSAVFFVCWLHEFKAATHSAKLLFDFLQGGRQQSANQLITLAFVWAQHCGKKRGRGKPERASFESLIRGATSAVGRHALFIGRLRCHKSHTGMRKKKHMCNLFRGSPQYWATH